MALANQIVHLTLHFEMYPKKERAPKRADFFGGGKFLVENHESTWKSVAKPH